MGEKTVRTVFETKTPPVFGYQTEDEIRKAIPNEEVIDDFLKSKTIGEAKTWIDRLQAKIEEHDDDKHRQNGEQAQEITNRTVCDDIYLKQKSIIDIELEEIKEKLDKELELKEKRDRLPDSLNNAKIAKLKADASITRLKKRQANLSSDKYPVNLKDIRNRMTEKDKHYTYS